MTYTYCAETTELTDAEIVAIVRGICGDHEADLDAISMFRIAAECDLAAGHDLAHASFQVDSNAYSKWANGSKSVWLRWDGETREVQWSPGVLDCLHREDGTLASDGNDADACMLFAGHPGDHCFAGVGDASLPSWARSGKPREAGHG